MRASVVISGVLITIIIFTLIAYKDVFLKGEQCNTVVNLIQGEEGGNGVVHDLTGDQRQVLGFLSYRKELKEKLEGLIKRKAPALDKELVSFVKEVMDAPATRGQIKMSRPLAKTPQAQEIDKILNQKKNGFFIEAGGYDGERSSNTIWFEKAMGWSGLLVEPDPYFYTQLMGKNRHSWSINACISPYDYASEIAFTQSLGGSGKLEMGASTAQMFKVPCYPLATLLASLGISKVDYFSLDVEGAEGVILEAIHFDQLDISTMSVEYRHGNKQKYVEIMRGKGYDMAKELVVHNEAIALWVDDFIFFKKE